MIDLCHRVYSMFGQNNNHLKNNEIRKYFLQGKGEQFMIE